jgi:general secretion pathway protein B
MSLILEALRKMEQERRSRRGAAQDLRPEVLRYRLAAQPKERARFPLAVVGGAALLCAGLAAGFLLKGHDPQPGTDATAAAAALRTQAAPVPPAVPVDVVPAPVPAAPAAATPVAAEAPVAVPKPAPLPAERPAKPLVAPAAAQAPVQPAAVPRRAPHEEAVAAPAGGQEIAISGIAYQDERRMRRAVLNGALVGEGAEVAGARVVEIRETKVRLSRGGQVFEVPFSSGLQSR